MFSAPPLPVEVHIGEQLIGVLIVKQVGTQVLARAEDLQQPGALPALAVSRTCVAGQYLVLPAALNPQLDLSVLVLRLSPEALTALNDPATEPAPDSPQTTGTLLNVGASVLAVGGPATQGSQLATAQLTGLLSTETDSRLRVVSAATDRSAQAFGVRSSSSFGVQAGNEQTTAQANVFGVYSYWQTGDLETDLGLIPASLQSTLAGQQGTPLLGISLRRASASNPDAPLRIDGPAGGHYRVLFRGVVLRQGTLAVGTTLVSDLLYPPVQDALSIEISDAGGSLLRSYAVPFDRRPQTRPVGTLDSVLEAGLRGGLPSAGLSGSLTVTPDTSVQAGALLGSVRGFQAGVRVNSQALALSADASLLIVPTGTTVITGGTGTGNAESSQGGDTQRRQISLGLSQAQTWGSWSLRGDAAQLANTSGVGAEIGRSTLLGLQAAVFLTRPALQIQGRVEQLASVAATDVAGPGATSTLRGELSLGGSFRLGRADPAGRSSFRSEYAESTNADWSVRVYASQTAVAGNLAAPQRQGGVSLGLNLRMLDGRPDLVVQSGVQNGLPLLAVERTTQENDLNLVSRVQVLPTPAASLFVSGPYTAGVSLTSGPSPVLAASLSGTLALTGAAARLLPSATRQALLVKVGVPGVQVRSGGTVATTDASGQAVLPLNTLLQRSDAEVLLESLPLSTSLSVLTLTVQPTPGALLTIADFTPYLLRTNLRRLPAFVPPGAVARLHAQRFTVQQSRYVQFDAQNGDQVAVTWPAGSCTAIWSDAEVLSCQNP